jgi:hypothetical protein
VVYTLAKFTLFKMFVQGNEYYLKMDGQEIKVKLNRGNNPSINATLVTIEFPYLLEEGEEDSNGSLVKKKCIDCLNRLGDVVRFLTKFYLIERIFEHDIFYLETETIDELGNRRRGFGLHFGGSKFFPLDSIPENKLEQDISSMLKDENAEIPYYENLLLDSYYYYTTGRNNEAVIACNISLEAIVALHLVNKLVEKGYSKIQARRRVGEIFSHSTNEKKRWGLHKVMSLDFEEIDGRSFKSTELWEKFKTARTRRKNVIHPYTTNLSPPLTLETIRNVKQIIDWIHRKS